MSARRFTDTEEKEIEKIYRVGSFSAVAIARQYLCAHGSILDAIRQAGGKIRTHKDALALMRARRGRDPFLLFTEAEEREIEKIYRVGGFSLRAIARQYPCSIRAVLDAIRRVGGKTRTMEEARVLRWARCTRNPAMLFTDAEDREIEKIYCVGGFSTAKIGRQYHCCDATIMDAVKRAGGRTRTRRENDVLNYPYLIHFQGEYPIISLWKLRGKARDIAEQMVRTAENVRVHRLVMALHLRRPLLPTEIVHHKDGNKANYHISNLELLTQEIHTSAWGNPYYQKWQEALTVVKGLRAKMAALTITQQARR